MTAAPAFVLPPALEAHEPPEARGLARDGVRLLVATRRDGRLVHARFHELPRFLAPGDLLVVNTSATLPAALEARRPDGSALALHLSTPSPDDADERLWFVELRRPGPGGTLPFAGAAAGERLGLPGGGAAELLARYAGGRRLWLARLEVTGRLRDYLHDHGRPIRYRHVPREWPLDSYQTAYAVEGGSAEMPSAGRPFTPELLAALAARGVLVAPLVLHTGVSSLEEREAPYPERYRVPAPTARLVNAVRGWGGRVVAVGTSVVRALETVAAPDGTVSPGGGWTSLLVTPERGVRAVDGLVTGWHDPTASHLQLLRAVAGDRLLDRSYRAALAEGYLWHEFGDSHLVLP
jgi:S-adenosylmethionine:tRNA ribosyltransferase-isomerase